MHMVANLQYLFSDIAFFFIWSILIPILLLIGYVLLFFAQRLFKNLFCWIESVLPEDDEAQQRFLIILSDASSGVTNGLYPFNPFIEFSESRPYIKLALFNPQSP